MSGELSVEVDRAHPVAAVRLHGVLDAYTAADLRAALLECLTDQPSGVLVDASDVALADDVALVVLASIAQQSQRWPGALVAIAGADGVTTAAYRLGILKYVRVCPDRETALRELQRRPQPPWRRDHIVPDKDAPSAARTAVGEFCQEHGVDGNGDAAQLVASELVTNAVVHAGTPIELTLRLEQSLLHIGVRDQGPGEARITGIVDESAESGRGLLLVDALASAWGSLVSHNGKVVWATVRVRR